MKNKIIIILICFMCLNKLSAQFVDLSPGTNCIDTNYISVVIRNLSAGGMFQYMSPTVFRTFMASMITYGTSRGTNVKIWDTVFTASTSSGQTVDISSAGFAAAPMVFATAERNTATATSCPQISLKTRSSTSLSFNLTEGSANLVTILGISVLAGPATIFSPTPSTILIHIFCIGS